MSISSDLYDVHLEEHNDTHILLLISPLQQDTVVKIILTFLVLKYFSYLVLNTHSLQTNKTKTSGYPNRMISARYENMDIVHNIFRQPEHIYMTSAALLYTQLPLTSLINFNGTSTCGAV